MACMLTRMLNVYLLSKRSNNRHNGAARSQGLRPNLKKI